MFSLFLLYPYILSKSSTNCFPFPSNSWEIYGNVHKENETTLIFANQTFAKYKSDRYRKKWMISICGIITSSYLQFDILENQDQYGIQILKNTKNYKIVFDRNNQSLESKETIINSDEYCWKILSGRGFIGLFLTQDICNTKTEPIFLSKLEFPRKHTFTYISNGFNKISQLCIGDYFGNERIQVKSTSDQWDRVNDFL